MLSWLGWDLVADLVEACALLVVFAWLAILGRKLRKQRRELNLHVCRPPQPVVTDASTAAAQGTSPDRLIPVAELLAREEGRPRRQWPGRPAERAPTGQSPAQAERTQRLPRIPAPSGPRPAASIPSNLTGDAEREVGSAQTAMVPAGLMRGVTPTTDRRMVVVHTPHAPACGGPPAATRSDNGPEKPASLARSQWPRSAGGMPGSGQESGAVEFDYFRSSPVSMTE